MDSSIDKIEEAVVKEDRNFYQVLKLMRRHSNATNAELYNGLPIDKIF